MIHKSCRFRFSVAGFGESTPQQDCMEKFGPVVESCSYAYKYFFVISKNEFLWYNEKTNY